MTRFLRGDAKTTGCVVNDAKDSLKLSAPPLTGRALSRWRFPQPPDFLSIRYHKAGRADNVEAYGTGSAGLKRSGVFAGQRRGVVFGKIVPLALFHSRGKVMSSVIVN